MAMDMIVHVVGRLHLRGWDQERNAPQDFVFSRINETRPGGRFRYEWTDGEGGGFHITGEFGELVPFNRIVHIERMHLPDPTPDDHIVTRFDPNGSGTLITMRMTLPGAATRAAMLATALSRTCYSGAP